MRKREVSACSHHRHDMLRLKGIQIARIEVKALRINSRWAMEHTVEYKNDRDTLGTRRTPR